MGLGIEGAEEEIIVREKKENRCAKAPHAHVTPTSVSAVDRSAVWAYLSVGLAGGVGESVGWWWKRLGRRRDRMKCAAHASAFVPV